jgi:hypothetical protein
MIKHFKLFAERRELSVEIIKLKIEEKSTSKYELN